MNRYKTLLAPVAAALLAFACTEANGPLLPNGTDQGLEPQVEGEVLQQAQGEKLEHLRSLAQEEWQSEGSRP